MLEETEMEQCVKCKKFLGTNDGRYRLPSGTRCEDCGNGYFGTSLNFFI